MTSVVADTEVGQIASLRTVLDNPVRLVQTGQGKFHQPGYSCGRNGQHVLIPANTVTRRQICRMCFKRTGHYITYTLHELSPALAELSEAYLPDTARTVCDINDFRHLKNLAVTAHHQLSEHTHTSGSVEGVVALLDTLIAQLEQGTNDTDEAHLIVYAATLYLEDFGVDIATTLRTWRPHIELSLRTLEMFGRQFDDAFEAALQNHALTRGIVLDCDDIDIIVNTISPQVHTMFADDSADTQRLFILLDDADPGTATAFTHLTSHLSARQLVDNNGNCSMVAVGPGALCARFFRELGAPMWTPGEAAVIDYSGDRELGVEMAVNLYTNSGIIHATQLAETVVQLTADRPA